MDWREWVYVALGVACPLGGFAIGGLEGLAFGLGAFSLVSLARLVGVMLDMEQVIDIVDGSSGPEATSRVDRLEGWLATHPETMKLAGSVVVPVCLSLLTTTLALLVNGRG